MDTTVGANIVRNSDVEAGKDSPDDWSFAWKSTHSNDAARGIEKQEPDWAWDSRERHSGKRSLRVGVKRSVDDGVWTQDGVVPVAGTRIYLVRAWIKARDLINTEASIGCVALGEKGKWLGANYGVISAFESDDWQLLVGYFEPPKGTVAIRVRAWVNMRYSGTGTAWFDDIELLPTKLTELPPMRYVDEAPLPPLSTAAREAGCVLFQKNYLEMVFPTTVPRPDEITDSLEFFATPGETEAVGFAIHSLRDLGTVRLVTSNLTSGNGVIPASALRANPVKCRVQRGQSRWGPHADKDLLVPVIVEETNETEIPAETTKHVWVTVDVPPDARAGHYRGHVTVVPEKGMPQQMGLALEVLPFQLMTPPDIYFGMYARFRPDLAWQRRAFADMRRHGMTTVGLCSAFGGSLEMDGDTVRVELDGTSHLEQAMRLYQEAGFPRPVLWLMGRDILNFCLKQGPLGSDRFAACYRQIIKAISDHRRSAGWPEIIFQPLDEPYEHAKRNVHRKNSDSPTILAATKRCLQIMKTIPGLRTEEDGANGAPQHLEELHPWVDVQTYHDGPVLRRGVYDADAWKAFRKRLQQEGKEVWFYNIDITGFHPEALRFGYGFGLYTAGATGMIEWAYMTGYKPEKPKRLYQSKLPLAYRYNPTESEPGGPTTAWEATREGVDDYRYLYTFLQAADEAKKRGDKALAASARNDIKKRLAAIDFNGCTGKACQGEWTGEKGRLPTGEVFVSGKYKMRNGLTFSDYDAIRRALANWIMKLRNK